jgi:hypothetical protein
MAGVGAPWAGHGELTEEREGGGGEGAQLGGRSMWRGMTEGGAARPRLAPACCSLNVRAVREILPSAVREKEEGKKREKGNEGKEKRKKRRKNMEKFLNMKNFREKNKR